MTIARTPLLKYLLLLIAITALSACQLSYPVQHTADLSIEQAIMPEHTDSSLRLLDLNNIDQLSFKPFDHSQPVDFRAIENRLLLKVNVNSFEANINEATLVISPKYFSSIKYSQISPNGAIEPWRTQFRNRFDENRYFSTQNFAFNIDDSEVNHTHLLLIESRNNVYVDVKLVDTQSYIRSDLQFSQFITLVYSIILALILFNTIFYFYNRDTNYLLYIIYMSLALYSLLWQEGKINDLPVLAWYAVAEYSSMFFIMLTDLAAIMFFYHFMRLSFKHSWWAKLISFVFVAKLTLVLFILIQHHLFNALNYALTSSLFNISVLINSLLIWLLLIIKTWQGFPQAKFLLVAWSIMIITVLLRIYYIFNPYPENSWMPQFYEIGIMLEALILAFAMADRTMRFKKERDQAVNQYTLAERSIYKNKLLTSFQQETQSIVKDPTLEKDKVTEKLKIKFHLLVNQAFPISSSFLLINKQLQSICSNDIKPQLISIVEQELAATGSSFEAVKNMVIHNNNRSHQFLIIPVETTTTRLVLGLKRSKDINPEKYAELKSFCTTAYQALSEAQKTHEIALSAHLDSMTGCHNRGSIEKIIDDSLENKNRTTVAYIDLDNLKNINDAYGHDAGDQHILKLVSVMNQQLAQHAKIGRIGGDEFIVVFSDASFEQCESLLEQLLAKVQDIEFAETDLTMTISIGLAESRLNENGASLLKKADVALYHAKKLGKNQLVVFQRKLLKS